MLKCPECGALSPVSATACSKCGILFEGGEGPAPLQPKAIIPPPPPPPIPEKKPPIGSIAVPQTLSPAEAPPRGLTSTAGMTNGTRETSVTATVERTAVPAGVGLTNGTGISTPRGTRPSVRVSAVRRWQFLAVLAAVAIVVPVFYFIFLVTPTELAVDGKFGDWSDAAKFGMEVQAIGAGISVSEWSVQNEESSLYWYINVEGTLMGTSNVDSFYLFVDSDHNSRTGYSVSTLGADYLLVLDGWEREVRTASLMEYGSSTDPLDWNSWIGYGSMSYSLNSDRIEVKADMPVVLGNSARYLLLSQTTSPDQDFSVSYPVPASGGLLIARIEPGSSIDQTLGTVPASANVAFAKLILSCDGTGGSVATLTPTVLGATLVSSFTGTSLTPGEEKSFDITIDTSSVPATSAVSAVLTEYDIASTFGDAVISQGSVQAYVGTAPASIEIDGAFGDWLSRPIADSDISPVANPNINMTKTAFDGATSFASFYVSVEGEMFKGAYAPSAKVKASGGAGGGPVTLPRKSGEDILRIFIDSDISNSTGLLATRDGKTVGADYLIDIRGTNGEIVSKELLVYNGVGWTATTNGVSAAKDMQQLELNVSTASIGGDAAIATIIETTDWKLRSDWAWAASIPDPWVVNGAGDTYQSDTGALWGYVGTPSLVPGDRIVDIAMTSDDSAVVLVTNTGRTYCWEFGVSTGWTVGEAYPIDTATYSEAVSMTFFSKTGAWLLTKNGSYFFLMNAISPPPNKEWTYQDLAESGVSDFTDMNYEGGQMYALRSGANTTLSYSNNGNSFDFVTNATGSTSNQTEFTYIPGGPSSTDDRIFVLCENGEIRYSANGGANWSSWGNLPTPTGGNTTRYAGIGIDSTGYMWVVTDTGYVFTSTDSTTYSSFNYTGQAPISDIVAIIPLPTVPSVPEFGYILVPIAGAILVVLSRRYRASRV